ncbi:precorrin-6y C5,15-methyltransferase (decarboxylating) subunit CbiE [Streptomyces olivaceoviridis]|uniref:precorrin-6y C5,15-methyltransferase (decarboxylating) subunit CbiE n=1 Tax=Streptomyces olivaceoviridis TaxID=1921 RepID=UPI00368039A8
MAVVGIGADGWDGLPETSRAVLLDAGVLIGGARHLTLLPAACRGERIPWPSPLRPAVRGLFAAHAGRRITVLASGDPMCYGIGLTLIEELGAGAVHVMPHPSSVSYACARLGRPLEDTDVATLVGRPTARLAAALHHGRRLLVLSADAATPGEVAALLRDRGFGPSRMRLLEQLCGEKECVTAEGAADDWPHPPRDPLNIVAVEVRRALRTDRPRLGAVPGLPDAASEHDGQLSTRHVHAATLGVLAPAPGELLWDIGGGLLTEAGGRDPGRGGVVHAVDCEEAPAGEPVLPPDRALEAAEQGGVGCARCAARPWSPYSRASSTGSANRNRRRRDGVEQGIACINPPADTRASPQQTLGGIGGRGDLRDVERPQDVLGHQLRVRHPGSGGQGGAKHGVAEV